MDGGGRAEAQRWLTAAEKLLATRDFHGTKSFAIRARESDPSVEAVDRLLSVVDTLLAGDCLINDHHPDWYGILQLGHLTQGVELIADHYRRLAVLLNPERNHFPFADQAFRLVSDAWNVLSDHNKKAFYDNELRMIQFGHIGFQQPPPPPPMFDNGAQPSRPPARRGRPPGSKSSAAAHTAVNSTEPDSFWTACPYCYMLYEYPRVYKECAIKCRECERSFQAVPVAPPPVTAKDTCYNCWAYFPLGYTGNDNTPGDGPAWKPMSTMFIPPLKEKKQPTKPGPRVYYDEDDIYVEVLNHSDDSDDADWNERPGASISTTKRKRGRPPKAKSPSGKSAPVEERLENTEPIHQKQSSAGEDIYEEFSDQSDDSDDADWNERPGASTSTTKRKRGRPPKAKSPSGKSGSKNSPVEEGPKDAEPIHLKQSSAGGLENVGVRSAAQPVERAESSRKAPGVSTRRQTGRGAKSLGKLDLNVECSNEVEEPSRAMGGGPGRGHGVEDTFEGTGFFEGLDEFLSNLPILSDVNDGKVKAA